MGIPGFSTWLREQYPEAFSPLPRGCSFDHVYIDMPSTLHSIIRSTRSRAGYHQMLHRRLDELLKLLRPKRRVMLALDGPAPLAKLLEQRRRRNREANRIEAEGLEELSGIRGGGSGGGGGSSSLHRRHGNAVSPLFLTTGTLFMLEIHSSLMYYICQKLAGDVSYRHLEFEFSDSNVKGEGELKILSRLLHDGDTHPEESHLVVGADSDLMLMLMISGQRNVALCSDVAASPRSRARHPLKALAFSCDALEATWRKELLGSDAPAIQVTELALDLTLLAILSHGNDYLPACAGVQLRNRNRPGLWNLYLDMRTQSEWQGQSLVRRICQGCTPSERTTAAAAAAQGHNVASEPPRTSDASIANDNETAQTAAAAISSSSSSRQVCFGDSHIEINREMLAALLQRYQEQRIAAYPDKNLASCTSPTSSSSSSDVEDALDECGDSVRAGRGQNFGRSRWKGSWDFGPRHTLSKAALAKLETTQTIAASEASHARLAADPASYLEGVMWVLSMYSTGMVRDYRFTYDGGSVPLMSLVSFLKETAPKTATTTVTDAPSKATIDDEDTATVSLPSSATPVLDKKPVHTASHASEDSASRTFKHATKGSSVAPSRSSLQPLIPAACALALLPARGRLLAATPLRHLMDADSPVAEIYAVCKECQRFAGELRAVSFEFGNVRKELTALQAALAGAPLDSEEVAYAETDLTAAAERCERAQDRLRGLLAELSRSQKEHLLAMHPFKPFPTAALEAAVHAVPYDRYPLRERKLLKFGREMVYRWEGGGEESVTVEKVIPFRGDGDSPKALAAVSLNNDGASRSPEVVDEKVVSGEAVPTTTPRHRSVEASTLDDMEFRALPNWLKDCARFTRNYPRIAHAEVIKRASLSISRQVLPMHPYMMPTKFGEARTSGPRQIVSMLCHIKRKSSLSSSGTPRRSLCTSSLSYAVQSPTSLLRRAGMVPPPVVARKGWSGNIARGLPHALRLLKCF